MTRSKANTVFVKIAAEELGLPLEVVEIAPLDTDNCPFALGSYSDRVTILGGEAVRRATVDARRQLIQLAAEYFSAHETQVVYERGSLYVKGSGQEPKPEQDQKPSRVAESKYLGRNLNDPCAPDHVWFLSRRPLC